MTLWPLQSGMMGVRLNFVCFVCFFFLVGRSVVLLDASRKRWFQSCHHWDKLYDLEFVCFISIITNNHYKSKFESFLLCTHTADRHTYTTTCTHMAYTWIRILSIHRFWNSILKKRGRDNNTNNKNERLFFSLCRSRWFVLFVRSMEIRTKMKSKAMHWH